MSQAIKLVLFDMDNVLYGYDRHSRAARLSEFSGGKVDDICREIWDNGFEHLGDSGTLSRAEYLQAFGNRIGYPLSLEEWLDARRFSTKPDAAMLEIVDRLRCTVEIAILTNNTELVTDHLDFLCPELRPLFGSKIYASARFKTAKPNTECFRRCLDEFGISPEATLFVDDLNENVVGARNAGLIAHHFTSPDRFLSELSRFGFQLEYL
ncbi:HAD family hydrolase [Rhizobium paknamense]|uniref:Hydrolase of the HAD superfamily n=1 Tax=Rhizobium paknamense TaxID=1206817 RepID=A0ABU0IG55_9HYPH|nr:HAD family phosphatase [Rhizobium paknamense]MDQ0456189.1 putative hydrolase of the HAD superfamily [Rhizobium paknamense]